MREKEKKGGKTKKSSGKIFIFTSTSTKQIFCLKASEASEGKEEKEKKLSSL